jgi:RecA-family ATPase
MLPESGFSLLVAKPKAGKSTLARNLALAVAQGRHFFGKSTQQGSVIYLALEEKRSEVGKHFRDMGATGEEDIYIFAASAPVDALKLIRAEAEQRKPVLIIIDPLFRLTRVKDGNDYAQVTAALEPLLVLARETRAHVLCVHHAGKGDREGGDSILGSTAIFAAVDTALILKRSERYRTISSIQRYGEDLSETVLHFDPQTRTVTLGATKEQEEGDRIAEAILACLKVQEEDQEKGHALTQAELDEEVEGKTVFKRRALKSLVDGKQVERIGKGGKGDPFRYALLNSRFLVPYIYKEQGNKNPKNGTTPQEDSPYSCSRDVSASEDSAKSRELENEAHDRLSLDGFDWETGEREDER